MSQMDSKHITLCDWFMIKFKVKFWREVKIAGTNPNSPCVTPKWPRKWVRIRPRLPGQFHHTLGSGPHTNLLSPCPKHLCLGHSYPKHSYPKHPCSVLPPPSNLPHQQSSDGTWGHEGFGFSPATPKEMPTCFIVLAQVLLKKCPEKQLSTSHHSAT